jgi:DNA-binding response OmpR family regulator
MTVTEDRRSSPLVLVVDATPPDYVRLAKWARQAGMRFHQLIRGQDALRAAATVTVHMWIINLDLPDMNGFELVERLQPRRRGSDLFLVADHYRREDELRALSLGVTMYLCKPARASWLRQWRPWPDRAAREDAGENGAGQAIEGPPPGFRKPFA